MKSLIGGMASFRIATFLSVLIIPVVSFFRPIFGVGSSITLMFQPLSVQGSVWITAEQTVTR